MKYFEVLQNRFKTNKNPDENPGLPMDKKNLDRKPRLPIAKKKSMSLGKKTIG